MKPLAFTSGDVRVRVLNARPPSARGEFVLYWSQMFRRADDNAALAYAMGEANARGLPCVVYEALRPDYPHASDRFHAFVVQGAKDTAARLAERGIFYAFFLPRTRDEARGVLAKLAARAAIVVSDDFPTFTIPAQNEHAAARAPCSFVVIDDCAVVPMALFPKQEFAARTLRPKMHRALPEWLRPIEEPEPKVSAPSRLDLPFDPLDLARADLAARVAACAIDHTVPAVLELPGGSRAAQARLDGFVRRKLSGYDVDRNDPSRDATSVLSAYLHFGMISARRVALAASPDDTAFLEQLLVRRGLSFNFARNSPVHTTYDGVPAWAKATLDAHARDKEKHLVSLEDMTDAKSPDELWNAAQLELRARGTIHNYARMLWGKLPIAWTKEPAEAHAALVHLNDRFALDGRDPNSYASISWCFGLHDRPWPERAIFGKVRTMTSGSARRKLDFEGYIAQAAAWRSSR